MEQQEFLKKELKQEVLKLLIPLVVGTIGIIGIQMISIETPWFILLGVTLLVGLGIGTFLGLLVDFMGNFFPDYLTMRK